MKKTLKGSGYSVKELVRISSTYGYKLDWWFFGCGARERYHVVATGNCDESPYPMLLISRPVRRCTIERLEDMHLL